MLVCKAVAIATHTRYGLRASEAQRTYGQMAIMDHTMVASTMRMSTSANTRLRRPNCIGVNAMFAAMLMTTGMRTTLGTLPRTTRKMT